MVIFTKSWNLDLVDKEMLQKPSIDRIFYIFTIQVSQNKSSVSFNYIYQIWFNPQVVKFYMISPICSSRITFQDYFSRLEVPFQGYSVKGFLDPHLMFLQLHACQISFLVKFNQFIYPLNHAIWFFSFMLNEFKDRQT